MYYTLNIPVKPYVKDYFEHLYGSPVVASKNNIIGITIEPYLSKTPSKPLINASESSMEVELVWTLKEYNYKDPRVYNYISPDNLKMFASTLDKLFWWGFYAYLDGNTLNGRNDMNKQLIYDFMDKFNLNPDNANYEMFKKRYYRYSKKFDVLSSK